MLIILLILVGVGVLAREYKNSLGVWEDNRFNMVAIDQKSGAISFVTYDPVEEKTLVINYPQNLIINSRSVGEYNVGTLYRLGAYEKKGGEFAKRKVQGFMRTPIQGYLAGEGTLRTMLWKNIWKSRRESNLSRIDSWYMWSVVTKHSLINVNEEELIRAGIIISRQDEAKYDYSAERLEQYLGERLFDWMVGREGATVAVVNMSGVDGLGSDLGRFLTNMGLDVIAVRSGNEAREETKIWSDRESKKEIALDGIRRVFEFDEAEESDLTKEFRADIVIEVGKDALSLF